MLNVLGETYYIDFDEVEKYIDMSDDNHTEIETDISGTSEMKVNIIKYEMIKMMLETVLTEADSVDEKLGPNNSELTIPFKISFNSLRVKNIINKL